VDGYGVVIVSKDISGRSESTRNEITVFFPYDPQLVAKVKTIEGRKWHLSLPIMAIRLRRRSNPNLRYIQEILGHKNSKTTEIHTQMGTKSIGKIKSPLDCLNLKKKLICDKVSISEPIWI
jgi:hypothetical protein